MFYGVGDGIYVFLKVYHNV